MARTIQHFRRDALKGVGGCHAKLFVVAPERISQRRDSRYGVFTEASERVGGGEAVPGEFVLKTTGQSRHCSSWIQLEISQNHGGVESCHSNPKQLTKHRHYPIGFRVYLHQWIPNRHHRQGTELAVNGCIGSYRYQGRKAGVSHVIKRLEDRFIDTVQKTEVQVIASSINQLKPRQAEPF